MRKIGFIDYLYFAEAWLLLHLARMAILVLPFKKIAARIGQLQLESSRMVNDISKINAIEHAIRRSARLTLHNSKCYDQALAGKIMLNRRKLAATLYLGLTKESENQLSAHAWVRCGDRIVTGKAGRDRFTVIACFGDA